MGLLSLVQIFGIEPKSHCCERLLHNGIIDGKLFARWKYGVDSLTLLYISRHHSVHQVCNLRNVPADGCYQRADVPNEDAGIPKVVACFEIALCHFEIGFLAERSHLIHIAHNGIGHFNIPVSGLRTIGNNAQSDYSIGIAGVVESLADDGAEEAYIQDNGIGRGDYNIGIGILLQDTPSGPGYTRCSIAGAGSAMVLKRSTVI